MKVLSAAAMQRLDREAITGLGIPSIVLMERAALGAARVFAQQFPLAQYPECLISAGPGNNGGDGLAIGRIMHGFGYRVQFLLLAQEKELKTDARTNLTIIKNMKLPWRSLTTSRQLGPLLRRCGERRTFIVDAIFGTGLNKPVGGLAAEVIQLIQRSGCQVAAVDIPSGLSEKFLPTEGIHVSAAVTATFHALKLAHIHPDGNRHCGKIYIVDIGIPRSLADAYTEEANLIFPATFADLLEKRRIDTHKGDFGHLLCLAGSQEKPGAAILAASAALRSGAGLVTVACAGENRTLIVQSQPELMTLPYEEPEEIVARLPGYSCIMAGPGLGTGKRSQRLIHLLLRNSRQPLILDADALNVLGRELPARKGNRRSPLILTPHPGEFARLTGHSPQHILRQRIALSREYARSTGAYLLLKGHHTVLATPAGRIWLNQTGNPGMASAGVGDVLSGMIAGLVAQFYPARPLETILAAAIFLHGYSGDLACAQKGPLGLIAGDIIAAIPAGISRLHEFHTPFPLC